MGDNYAKALSYGMKFTEHLKEIHLGGNSLTSKGISPFLKTVRENHKLYHQIELLDLSYNKLTEEGVRKLCEFISEPNCELREINVEGNCLGDNVSSILIETIGSRLGDKIQAINMGKNSLSSKSGLAIAKLLQNCLNLRELILCWNDLKNFESAQIISKVKDHTELRFLDLSFNSIGNNLQKIGELFPKEDPAKMMSQKIEKTDSKKKDQTKGTNKGNNEKVEIRITNREMFNLINTFSPPKKIHNSHSSISFIPLKKNSLSPFAKELGEMFKQPKLQLTHLDISNNNINYLDCEKISEDVKENHSIIGIHVDGNEMKIDSQGFITPIRSEFKDEKFYANSQLNYRFEKDHYIKAKSNSVRSIRGKNNCWVCEVWREMDLMYVPSKDLLDQVEEVNEVNIHLDFDEWKPTVMSRRFDHFIVFRMCPPGEIYFYYTINQSLIYVPNLRAEQMHDLSEPLTFWQGENQSKILKVCKKTVELNKGNLDPFLNANLKHCVPRFFKKQNEVIRPKTAWSFSISLWARNDYLYEGESEEFIDEVYDHDFNRINKNKEGKLDESIMECKTYLRNFYRKILECYKFLSSILGSNVWQITQNALVDFANNCPGLLDENYNTNFLLLQETTVKALDKGKKYKFLPDNIVRHQFINLLMRVAREKYIQRVKQTSSPLEAVKLAMENHFLPAIEQYDFHNWRKKRYYNENVDNLLKAHIPILDAIFKSWAPLKDPGKKVTWMELKEFNDLILKIVDKEFPMREIPLIFNVSIKLQLNEIDYDRHYNMFFFEFIEAFCRIIDKFSPIPLGADIIDWPVDKRESQHLSLKLENFIPHMNGLITSTDFKHVKEKFILPKKDDETGLFKYDPSSSFYTPYAKIFDIKK